MGIYRMTSDKLEEIPATSFANENIMERGDLQRLLRDQPDVLEEDLFILSEEFSKWQDSSRSIDLLGLDSTGRLTVIELKRTRTGDHAELQAIRYAAMVSVLTSEDLVEAHQVYLAKWGIEGDASELIQQHLASTDYEEIYTNSPRIMLVSEGFSNELTTSVLWLNDNGLDITCIQLQPYLHDSEILIESSQVIPVPGTEELLVQAQSKSNEAKIKRGPKSPSVPGGEAFQEAIRSAPDEIRQELERLHGWAAGLQEQGLANLKTVFPKTQTSLWVIAPSVRGTGTILKITYFPDHPRRDYPHIWLLSRGRGLVLDALPPKPPLPSRS